MTAPVLRGLAIAIAVAGAIDPAITSTRRVRPEVALVVTDPSMEPLASRVAEELDDAFTVIPAAFAGAAGIVGTVGWVV